MTRTKEPKIVKGTVTTYGRDDQGGPIVAREMDAFILGGLAAHRHWNAADDDKRYKITHVASGKAVAQFPGITTARKALKALQPVLDWTQDEKSVLAAVESAYNYGRIRQVVRDCGGL